MHTPTEEAIIHNCAFSLFTGYAVGCLDQHVHLPSGLPAPQFFCQIGLV